MPSPVVGTAADSPEIVEVRAQKPGAKQRKPTPKVKKRRSLAGIKVIMTNATAVKIKITKLNHG